MDFTSTATSKGEEEPDELVDLDTMHCTKTALGKVNLPLKAHFVPGKVVNVQCNGGSWEGHAMGRFIIPDVVGVEIVYAG